jgi:PTS system mannitol-specific IIA component
MADPAGPTLTDLLAPERVLLGRSAPDWQDAVRQVGEVLVGAGAVPEAYVEAMVERDRDVSTFIGEGVAIPHGTLAGRDLVERDALCVVQFPAGVDWHGEDVVLCVGIAAQGEGHVPILAQLAQVLMEPDRAEALRTAATAGEVLDILAPADDGD